MYPINWKKYYAPLLAAALVLLLASLSAKLIDRESSVQTVPRQYFSEKVNLALRRAAHHLLAEAGDSSSLIAPVQQTDAVTWLILLERPFDYNRLPELLQQSLAVHGIHENYDVAVLSCDDGALQLGYNFGDYQSSKDLACGGREMGKDCYNLQIRFVPAAVPAPWPGWTWIAAFTLLAGVVFLGIRLARKRAPQAAAPPPAPVETDLSNQLAFGDSRLDIANQMLTAGATRHKLTYREAKLLHLFASHPNQLLEREFILQSVWADEGILVGRSVDVFVSRLRKLLRADDSLRLVAVHGVGYRLEVMSDEL